jgi:putative ABC transport system permease protein
MAVVVRSQRDAAWVGDRIREAVRAVDPGQPVAAITTLDALFATSTAARRLPAVWIGTFAALACVLAAIGVYGVVLYSVSARSRELAVRAALGCGPSRLVRGTMWVGVRPIVLGGLAGLTAAGALSHLISGVLYEVQPIDPVSFAAAFGVATAAGVLASYVPARRARCLDPLTALRHE